VKGERIYVADLCEGLSFVKYRKNEKLFSIFADSLHPRYVTASCPVDYDTVVSDRFMCCGVVDNDHADGTVPVWDPDYYRRARTSLVTSGYPDYLRTLKKTRPMMRWVISGDSRGTTGRPTRLVLACCSTACIKHRL